MRFYSVWNSILVDFISVALALLRFVMGETETLDLKNLVGQWNKFCYETCP